MIKIKNVIFCGSLLFISTSYCAQEKKEEESFSSPVASLDESRNAQFTIISQDGKSFNVPFNIAMQSKLIKAACEKEHKTEILVKIHSVLLKQLLESMRLLYLLKNPSQKVIYEFIQNHVFKNFNIEQLAQAFKAAIYLDNPKLENVFADRLAQLVTAANINKLVVPNDPEQWFLIEKFYYLRSPELKPNIDNLLLNSSLELVNFLNINFGNLDYKRKQIIKHWKLSINDLIDYKEIATNNYQLDLSGFYLASLDGLQRMPNLQSLHLTNNQITTLNNNFNGLNNLRVLYLSYNQITALGNSLKDLNNLEVLNLDNNQITTLGNSFHGLNNLDCLILSNNQITTLGNSLKDLNNLEVLDLSKNQITTLGNSFNGLNKLNELSLSGNPLNVESRALVIQLRSLLDYFAF